jgi:hypoxanthine phosphoribosyltransferase
MDKPELKLVLPVGNVKVAVERMAREIRRVGSPLTFVVVLKGGVYIAHEILKVLSFGSDIILLQHLHTGEEINSLGDIVVGYIGLSSYGESTKSQGSVRVMSPLDLSTEYITGRNVVIVDDCIETGNTLYWAKRMLQAYEPKSIHTAVLVDKISLREKHGAEKPDIVGYVYPGQKFLVGMGMGYKERYRELPELYEIN